MPAIDYFNSTHPLRRLASIVALRAREKQFRIFEEHFGGLLNPGLRVLDLGSTPDESLPDSNLFARLLQGKVKLTLCSPEDCSVLAKKMGAEFLSQKSWLEGGHEFDLVISIAVLEHCGSRAGQRAFVESIERGGRYYFVTTPYRWFPVEYHTFLPLLHWLPARLHRWLLARVFRESFWSREENLNLLGGSDGDALFSKPHAHLYTHLLGLRANQLFVRSPKT